VKPAKLKAAQRIVEKINRDIKSGSIDVPLLSMVITGIDRNESHPIHSRIIAEAKKERLIK